MKLRQKTIKVIAETIAGDNEYSFYRSGPQLVDFYNEFGFDSSYGQGFPTRWTYAQDKLIEIIEQNRFVEFINYCLDESLYFEDHENEYETQDVIIEYWNKYLKFDNYEIIRDKNSYRLKDLKTAQVIIKKEEIEILSTEFMSQQIEKCDKKILDGDYDGAITNARSLVEEVLLALEERITGERGKNKGDISEIYNRVKKYINFDQSQKDLNETLKQILTGLNSIVIGVGRLRSKASDSHARAYKPSKHHAELAVNTAKTFTSFIISSYLYQQEKKETVSAR
ncbi:abortive infection family protein [Bacillus bingmayongensis]|uniref:abortive infection family protein n=1 Tax=Bacillus bingmayongensis TaxID=1150157 RepID=UPI001C8D878C|nr:abortive infection family protein [Bacillus bingmayongensis]MBY0597351.1 abortive infection family protein [Bacillus bingmayongensis]